MENDFDVAWTPRARKEMERIFECDVKSVKKIFKMIEEIVRIHKNGDNPLSGTGKPEFLKGNMSGAMSRRINEKERLVYYFDEDVLVIVSCLGHYEDK